MSMRGTLIVGIAFSAILGCGPTVEPEPQGEGESSAAEGSSSGGTSSASASTTRGGSSTGGSTAESETAPAESTTSEPEHPDITGTWECLGFEDPIVVEIEAYQFDPPAIMGRGCGASLDAPPLEGNNCDELAVNELLPPVQFQFELPYPDFPDFGPLGVEFLGVYSPELDVLGGTLWVSTVGSIMGAQCVRAKL